MRRPSNGSGAPPPRGRGPARPDGRPGPGSPAAPEVGIPGPGEPVPWTGALRADVPHYVLEQVREAAHRARCTRVSLLLRVLAEHRDRDGRALFRVRPEDLVPDRRKARRHGR